MDNIRNNVHEQIKLWTDKRQQLIMELTATNTVITTLTQLLEGADAQDKEEAARQSAGIHEEETAEEAVEE